MGKVIPLQRARSLGLGVRAGLRPVDHERGLDWELFPIVALLFIASLARVAHALWCHEPFDTEPTVALLFVLGLPWLALGRAAKRP